MSARRNPEASWALGLVLSCIFEVDGWALGPVWVFVFEVDGSSCSFASIFFSELLVGYYFFLVSSIREAPLRYRHAAAGSRCASAISVPASRGPLCTPPAEPSPDASSPLSRSHAEHLGYPQQGALCRRSSLVRCALRMHRLPARGRQRARLNRGHRQTRPRARSRGLCSGPPVTDARLLSPFFRRAAASATRFAV